MPRRDTLEKYQLLAYLAAIATGLLAGQLLPTAATLGERALWPLLALLLYSTFTQVPLVELRRALADRRFIGAAVLGNFVLLPLILWAGLPLLPDEPALRLGILLVLLVPCTDWFITFSQLGGGDARRALAFSPVSLLLQLALLPPYLWLLLGEPVATAAARQEMLLAFGGLILLPLLAAFITERWVAGASPRQRLIDRLAWCPVPLLALVLLVIAAGQVQLVSASLGLLPPLAGIYITFLLLAAGLARALAGAFRLPVAQGRTLAFSLGTRNSFVVLPLALALPPGQELAVVAIVFQSLIELLGMVAFLWWIPKQLFPASAAR
ncbi:arsenic resistance protein [Zobellella endophytica]|uniref:arsenic resistance protein n=1 Tax=Zobellella endophytica TaxID=2116700 RepID=UPI001FED0F90|nr:arsenic resistance protein [Zobellella endophytica]